MLQLSVSYFSIRCNYGIMAFNILHFHSHYTVYFYGLQAYFPRKIRVCQKQVLVGRLEISRISAHHVLLNETDWTV